MMEKLWPKVWISGPHLPWSYRKTAKKKKKSQIRKESFKKQQKIPCPDGLCYKQAAVRDKGFFVLMAENCTDGSEKYWLQELITL